MTSNRIPKTLGSRGPVTSPAVGKRSIRPRSRASVRVVALVVALAGSSVVAVPSATLPAAEMWTICYPAAARCTTRLGRTAPRQGSIGC